MQLTRTHLFVNRLRRQLLSHIVFVRLAGILVSLLLLAGLFFLFRGPVSQISAFLNQFTGSALATHSGRTNFLLLGIGGGNHDGFDLTDTIIFVSADPVHQKLTLISVPRDLWVSSMRAKINTAYHYGSQKAATAGGLLLAESAVSETINQPVDYAVLLDFTTFRQAIDLVGGINVTVDRSFTDSHYPITGKENDPCGGDLTYACRYRTVQFTAGPAHFDGTTALEFVRSRYSSDPVEGTDFGRSARQEKVIKAFISRLSSPAVLRHPRLYLDLFRLFTSSTATDIRPPQYYSLARLVWSLRRVQPASFTISEPDQLYNPPLSPRYDNQWILLPKNDDPRIVFDYVAKILGTP